VAGRRGRQAAGPGDRRADQADDRLGDLEPVSAAGLPGKQLHRQGRIHWRKPRLADAHGVVIGKNADQVLAQFNRRAHIAVGARMRDLLFAAGRFEVRRDRVHEPLAAADPPAEAASADEDERVPLRHLGR
jgi:hypothetical protein